MTNAMLSVRCSMSSRTPTVVVPRCLPPTSVPISLNGGTLARSSPWPKEESAPSSMSVSWADPRLVVLLRDPVERALSDYQHMCRLGFEDLSFPEALEAEPRRVAREMARMAGDPGYFSWAHHHFYTSQGGSTRNNSRGGSRSIRGRAFSFSKVRICMTIPQHA